MEWGYQEERGEGRTREWEAGGEWGKYEGTKGGGGGGGGKYEERGRERGGRRGERKWSEGNMREEEGDEERDGVGLTRNGRTRESEEVERGKCKGRGKG